MRKIELLVIHCSDSDLAAHDNKATIDAWHEERGFKSPSGIHIGYHYFIDKSGILHTGRPLEEVGSHAKGYNGNSIGVCLSGRYQFFRGQLNRLKALIIELRQTYGDFQIIGHNAINENKTCPNFPWKSFVMSLPAYRATDTPKVEKPAEKPEEVPQATKKEEAKPQAEKKPYVKPKVTKKKGPKK